VKGGLIAAIVGVFLILRIWLRIRRRRTDQQPIRSALPFTSDVGLVAAREMRERFRGRIFRVGTVLILAVVAVAIVIPTLGKGKAQPQAVGVVGPLPTSLRTTVANSAKSVGTSVRFVAEKDESDSRADLISGSIVLAILRGEKLLVNKTIGPTDTTTTAQFVLAVSKNLGVAEALEAAHLTVAQASKLAAIRPLPVSALQPAKVNGTEHTTSLIGIILIFVMLSQYNTWTLIGVMEEKSSRVIEVLLAAVRPIQLLTGKVLGIGLVAFAQASLIVAFALVLAKSVGSNLLHGTAPLVLVSTLVWLVLGYGFYCWVYAAAGSMTERQEQVQSLAFPLSLPIIFGYIMAITAASSGSTSTFFTILAYLPPTAPFAMPVLVGLGRVTLWEFLTSVVISIACTVGVARLATGIYRRAILRTGGRVKLRDVLRRTSS